MKIHVFTTVDESYRYGSLNDSEKKFFISEELRDEYYKFVYSDYKDNMKLIDHGAGDFNDTNYKWAYSITKGEEDLEIIDEKNW
jgi:hypothetical protein